MKRWFPDGRAVDKALRFGDVDARIIGVIGDIRQSTLNDPAAPTIYVNNLFQSRTKTTIVARTTGDPLATARAIREAIWSLDRDQPIAATFTLEDALDQSVARPRLLAVILGAFGVLGLVLGAVGIYGVLAYAVGQRRREIGVRLALGAEPRAVQRMFIGRGMALAASGIAVGIVGALVLGRFMSGILYGVQPRDPVTLALVVAVLMVAAWFASWLPARRASRLDPVVALRAD